MATQLINGEQQFFDANGDPLASGTVDFYIPATTTRKNTWTDAAATTLNTNPVVLDAAGRAIIYGTGVYRQVLKDSAGNTIWDQETTAPGDLAGPASSTDDAVARFDGTDGKTLQNSTDTLSNTGVYAHGGQTRWKKGADIASASPLVLGTDGNYFDVTGTTGFSSITCAAGTLFMLQFDGALTLTHGASLDLPGEANITTAAGDRLIGFAEAANTVQVLSYFKADGTAIVGVGNTLTTQGDILYRDGSGYARLGPGTSGQFLKTQGAAANPTWADVDAGITFHGEQATTSGTSVTFGSIPAEVKRITIVFNEVTLSDDYDVTIGDSGGLETSGYISTSHYFDSGSAPASAGSTAAFTVNVGAAGQVFSGHMVLTRLDAGSNTWIESHAGKLGGDKTVFGGGSKTLSAELTQVSIAGGTFSAGSINVLYE